MIELCNDGVEYAEPEPIVIPEPEPYIPTYEEVLNEKIMELSSVCQSTIERGLDINGLHYSYTEKDQINLNDIVSTVKLTGLPLGYLACLKESDKSREIIESYTYGTPLMGTYFETYNNMVNLYNAQIQALFPINN